MKQVFARRLLKVARALRESKEPKKFTMVMYGHGCGTPACALGHYASRRDLQKTFALEVDTYRGDESTLVTNDGCGIGFDDSEVATHFGLDSEEAHKLFSADGCDGASTVKQAAKFIERFVAKKAKGEATR